MTTKYLSHLLRRKKLNVALGMRLSTKSKNSQVFQLYRLPTECWLLFKFRLLLWPLNTYPTWLVIRNWLLLWICGCPWSQKIARSFNYIGYRNPRNVWLPVCHFHRRYLSHMFGHTKLIVALGVVNEDRRVGRTSQAHRNSQKSPF